MANSVSTAGTQTLDLSAFKRNGYLLVKNVFSAEEIADLRRRMLDVKARSLQMGSFQKHVARPKALYVLGDLLGHAELADFQYVVLHRRVLDCARQILGPKIVYFGDSSVQFGEADRGFHKDNVDRLDQTGPDWKDPYTVIRFGLYLQDHSRHSGGLKVRVGSHMRASHKHGQIVDVPSEAGDLVIWSLRLTHSGNNVKLAAWPGLCLHPRIERHIPDSWRVPEASERIPMFFTLGAPSEHVDHFVQNMVQRGDYRPYWEWAGLNRKLVALAAQSGVEFRRPIPEYGTLNPDYEAVADGE